MDYEQARFNMIEQQVRTWDVLDQQVLDLMGSVHREDFIPDTYKKVALADVNIPLLHDQVTMTPKVEARALQAVTISTTDKILEIGTGCTYLTTLLAMSGKHVVSVDIHPEFTQQAIKKLSDHAVKNVELHTGNAVNGWAAGAPYNVIMVTGSLPILNPELEQQLQVGGRLFVIVGMSPVMSAMLITRTSNSSWTRKALFETDLPTLIGADTPVKFRF